MTCRVVELLSIISMIVGGSSYSVGEPLGSWKGHKGLGCSHRVAARSKSGRWLAGPSGPTYPLASPLASGPASGIFS